MKESKPQSLALPAFREPIVPSKPGTKESLQAIVFTRSTSKQGRAVFRISSIEPDRLGLLSPGNVIRLTTNRSTVTDPASTPQPAWGGEGFHGIDHGQRLGPVNSRSFPLI